MVFVKGWMDIVSKVCVHNKCDKEMDKIFMILLRLLSYSTENAKISP